MNEEEKGWGGKITKHSPHPHDKRKIRFTEQDAGKKYASTPDGEEDGRKGKGIGSAASGCISYQMTSWIRGIDGMECQTSSERKQHTSKKTLIDCPPAYTWVEKKETTNIWAGVVSRKGILLIQKCQLGGEGGVWGGRVDILKHILS